jgi:2-methylisocitrate lyase-like PEP mutase family enzyme
VAVTDQQARIERFRELHHGPAPLLLPNPWDAGSARLLASLGFEALATTSSGFAATLGRLDGNVTRDEALAHAADIVAATEVPVSADLEHGFGEEPDEVAETVRRAVATGLAGCSIEDATGRGEAPIFEPGLAVVRVQAAVEAIRQAGVPIVLTARADGYLHGHSELADVIARLQGFQEAGADVLYAPGLRDLGEIRTLVGEVDRPVNVLALPGGPTIGELADVGVARVSVGGGFAYAALGGLVDAATELRDHGTYGFWEQGARGRAAVRRAFGP